MMLHATKASPRPRVGVKPPPWGAVGGWPCRKRHGWGHELPVGRTHAPGLTRGLSAQFDPEAANQAQGRRHP